MSARYIFYRTLLNQNNLNMVFGTNNTLEFGSLELSLENLGGLTFSFCGVPCFSGCLVSDGVDNMDL